LPKINVMMMMMMMSQCLKWSARGVWGGSVGDGRSHNRRPGDGLGMGYFKILSIKMVHSGVLIILFCTVNWLDVEQLNI